MIKRTNAYKTIINIKYIKMTSHSNSNDIDWDTFFKGSWDCWEVLGN